jgi:hypothetical protein
MHSGCGNCGLRPIRALDNGAILHRTLFGQQIGEHHMQYFQHAHAWIPDLLAALFCFAIYVKLNPTEETVEAPAPVEKKSVYPIPRGRMS